MAGQPIEVRPWNIVTRKDSEAGKRFVGKVKMPAALAPGFHPTEAHDLMFHGGKTLPHLEYKNFFIGGQAAWKQADRDNIDQKLAAAMSDTHLNNVMAQYFPDSSVTTTFKGSEILAGPRPGVVSQGDVEGLVKRMHAAHLLDGLDLGVTVVNLLLPSRTVLTTDEAPTAGAVVAKRYVARKPAASAKASAKAPEDHDGELDPAIPLEDEASSKQGLGGYHGSVHIMSGLSRITIYYAVGAFSETLPNGTQNGIVAFDKPWKNVVGTMYHELQEARTDPDVEDAIRAGNAPAGVKFLGWTSRQGEECGDFPIFEAGDLGDVFVEVPLTDGSGTVPIQFQYSNAVHGPEGPIAAPHQLPAPVPAPVPVPH